MNALITESLKHGDVRYLVSFNRKLLNKTEVSWLDFVNSYISKFGQPPTLDRFETAHKTSFVAVHSLDPLLDVYEQEVAAHKNAYVRAYIQAHIEELRNGDDPSALVETLHKDTLTDSSMCVSTQDFDKSEYYRKVIMTSFGIPTIDEATGGLGNGDLMYIVGRPADGKTTLLLHLMASWFWQGKNILLISNEIPWKDMLYKIDCILVGATVGEKRSGNFSDETKAKMAALKYIQGIMPNKITIPDRPVRKPAEIYSLVEQHKPDIVCIDGAYMMSMTGQSVVDWQDLAAVSRELKQLVNTKEIPIVGVIQANRTAEGAKNVSGAAIAGTDALFQDPDIILAVRSDSPTTFGRSVVCSTTKNRHGVQASTVLEFNFLDMTFGEVA